MVVYPGIVEGSMRGYEDELVRSIHRYSTLVEKEG
jgi:hypothetical protein